MTLYDFLQVACYSDEFEIIQLIPSEDGYDKIRLCEPKEPWDIWENMKDILDYDVTYFFFNEGMKDLKNRKPYLRVYVESQDDLRRQYNGK